MRTEGWCGVVLAGGKSSRMGRDKALIEQDGHTLIERALNILEPHVDELIIIGDPKRYDHFGPLAMADDQPGNGPLGGIHTALRYAWNDRIIVLACDMPNVNGSFVEYLKAHFTENAEAVVAQCDGQLEPLAAIYSRKCLKVFGQQLANGALRMSDAIEAVRTRYVQVCPGEEGWPTDLFRNINAPGDL
ncbi:MAG TPA: molybdenum cofactor guanylyltransferase [Flavobacteriales bacterium]|nr:molybdenum cofactor guanylyltransferase [Flavobacteriales bacterium]